MTGFTGLTGFEKEAGCFPPTAQSEAEPGEKESFSDGQIAGQRRLQIGKLSAVHVPGWAVRQWRGEILSIGVSSSSGRVRYEGWTSGWGDRRMSPSALGCFNGQNPPILHRGLEELGCAMCQDI